MPPPRLFRVAGRTVATDLAGEELAPFQIPDGDPDRAPAGSVEQPGQAAEARPVYSGLAWAADDHRSVECRVDASAYRLKIGGVGTLWVALDGRSLGCSRLAPGADPRLARLALLGPAMSLALALQGTFCLHASAVEVDSGALAFAGESGAGKSTLARGLVESSILGRRRAGDDVLPIELASGRPAVRTDFPQLKLPPAEQPYANGPLSLPLRAVFLLQGPAASGRAVRIEPLGVKESLLTLVRHTVAARLFAGELLERHLCFLADLAARTPVGRLCYPRGPGSLPRIADAIAAELE